MTACIAVVGSLTECSYKHVLYDFTRIASLLV